MLNVAHVRRGNLLRHRPQVILPVSIGCSTPTASAPSTYWCTWRRPGISKTPTFTIRCNSHHSHGSSDGGGARNATHSIASRSATGDSHDDGISQLQNKEDVLIIAAMCGAMGCILGGAVVYGRRDKDENEQVWWGKRGPLSLDRAVQYGPMGACVGSGLLAAMIKVLYPARVPMLSFPSTVHKLLALPLTILIAFRFQGSYERWWNSRQDLESFVSCAVQLAMLAANDVDPQLNATKEQVEQGRANEERMLGLLDAIMFYAESALMQGQDPHPANEAKNWVPEPYLLMMRPDEYQLCSEAEDPLLWCIDSYMGCIQKGQKLGLFSPESASSQYGKACELHVHLRAGLMVNSQNSPAAFIVHMRTFLFFFCFTYPFTIMMEMPWYHIPTSQALTSFSLLGIEFCSREMEHPFGDDASDLPCRKVLSETRIALRQVQKLHSDTEPSARTLLHQASTRRNLPTGLR